MKIFIDGFGLVGQTIVRKLLEVHHVDPKDILVNSYDLPQNASFYQFLIENKVNYFIADYNQKSAFSELKNFNPDIIASIYGRRIIPQYILDMANHGTFNFHPSLLPNYKGCFSVSWAIINREKVTGITIHEMVDKVDQGKILLQRKVEITQDDTAYSLWHKLADLFIRLFDDFYRDFSSGKVIAQEMPTEGTFYFRRLPHDGLIDRTWHPEKIEHFIRGIYFPPYSSAKIKIGDEYIEVDNYKSYLKLMTNK